jgi:hypothetical protein
MGMCVCVCVCVRVCVCMYVCVCVRVCVCVCARVQVAQLAGQLDILQQSLQSLRFFLDQYLARAMINPNIATFLPPQGTGPNVLACLKTDKKVKALPLGPAAVTAIVRYLWALKTTIDFERKLQRRPLPPATLAQTLDVFLESFKASSNNTYLHGILKFLLRSLSAGCTGCVVPIVSIFCACGLPWRIEWPQTHRSTGNNPTFHFHPPKIHRNTFPRPDTHTFIFSLSRPFAILKIRAYCRISASACSLHTLSWTHAGIECLFAY